MTFERVKASLFICCSIVIVDCAFGEIRDNCAKISSYFENVVVDYLFSLKIGIHVELVE